MKRLDLFLMISICLLTLFSIGSVQSLSCTDNITTCGSFTGNNKVYCLNSNINDAGSSNCLIFSSQNNVSLDCQGYKFYKSSLASGYGIQYQTSTNFEIKNCVIEDFVTGIYGYYTNNNNVSIHNNTIINPNRSAEFIGYGFRVRGNNYEIYNNSVTTNETLSTYRGDNGTIYNNTFITGLTMSLTTNSKIMNNKFYGGYWNGDNWNGGIFLTSCNNTEITNNTFSDFSIGISVQSSEYTTLRNNTLTNVTGLYFFVSSANDLNDYIRVDVDDSNNFGGMPVYYKIGLANTVIQGLQNKSIYCVNCTNVTIQNIDVDVGTVGLAFSNDSTIKNINAGIIYAGSGAYTIKDSNLENGYYGLQLSYITFSNISNVNISGDVGIVLGSSGNNEFSRIKIKDGVYSAGMGILLSGASNNIFRDSIIERNFGDSYDILLMSGSDNNKFYNNLFNSSLFDFSGGSSNEFNTTRQNGTRIYSYGNEIGGNYWTNITGNGYSDTCTDVNQTGFCDDAYDIVGDRSNYDYLALSDEHPAPPIPPAPSPSMPLNDTLSDVGQGVGNLLLNMSSPIAIFIILIALGSMVGYMIASIGKRIGGKI